MLQGKLYKIHMTEGNYEILKEGIENNCFLVSNSNKHVAWMEEMDPYASSNIVLMDLESGETTRITAEEGTKVRSGIWNCQRWGYFDRCFRNLLLCYERSENSEL